MDYDKEPSVLRISGMNVLENEHVKIGAFHTLELEVHRPFVLTKDGWDSLAFDTLHQASDSAASNDLAVILMQEGVANILLVSRSMTITVHKMKLQILASMVLLLPVMIRL